VRRVRAAVLADPLILDMDDFFTDGFFCQDGGSNDIAGLALLMYGRDAESCWTRIEEARKVLGLSSRAAKSLFLVSGWQEDLRRGFVTEPMTPGEYRNNAEVTRGGFERLYRGGEIIASMKAWLACRRSR